MARRINFYDKLLYYARGVLLATADAVLGTWKWNRSYQDKLGPNVASGTSITLPLSGNAFNMTGTTQTDYASTTGWQAGAVVTLIFSTAITIRHNQGAAPTGFVKFMLAGAVSFVSSAEDTLTLRYDGVAWREIARAVI